MTDEAASVGRRARTLIDADAEPVALEMSRFGDLRVADMAIRFAFGFSVSVCAGAITLAAGDHIGGVFLAFPAILPASLTLIADKHGDDQAELDAAGAVIGAIALVAFAITAFALFVRVNPAITEIAALAAWTCGAIGLYFITRNLLRRPRRTRA